MLYWNACPLFSMGLSFDHKLANGRIPYGNMRGELLCQLPHQVKVNAVPSEVITPSTGRPPH